MDNLIVPTEEIRTPAFEGRIQIYKTNNATGETSLIEDKHNLVVYTGADTLAKALAGEKYAGISHMYVGFDNGADVKPAITKSSQASNFALFTGNFGVLRLPLSFTPSFFADTNYTGNTALFSTVISSATSTYGAVFTSTVSNIYEVGLISANDPTNINKDVLFSRASFTPIQYVSGYNLTIVWGVKFTC